MEGSDKRKRRFASGMNVFVMGTRQVVPHAGHHTCIPVGFQVFFTRLYELWQKCTAQVIHSYLEGNVV
jgi:hypothetical protein